MTKIDGSWTPELYRHKQVASRIEQLTLQLSSGQRMSGPSDHPSDWREFSTARERLTALSSVNDAMSSLAVSLREVSHAIDAVARFLEDLQGEYEAIVQCGTPPPTPQLLEEQRIHVAKFNGILNQIDDVTSDNVADIPRTLLGDSSKPGNGDLEVIVDESGATRIIRAQGLHSGLGGLNLFSIAIPPDGVQMEAMAQHLEAARDTLQTRRQSFDWDRASLSRAIQGNEETVAQLVTHAENLQAVNNEQTAAALQSLQVGQALVVNAHHLVYELKSSLLELLG